jgi:hypothetical protein
MKVRVLGHYRVVDQGKAYSPGQIVDVADDLAKSWLLWGYVEAVDPPPEPAPGQPAEQPEQLEQTDGEPKRKR